MEMGEGATGGGEDAMGMGGGDLRENMLVYLQTRLTATQVELEEMEAEVAARDVQLFAGESKLTVVR